MMLTSQVIITSQFDETIAELKALSANRESFVLIVKEDKFLVDDANLAIEKAYLASQELTIIILAAPSFSAVVQNKLLKVIEEPPPNKEFILLIPNKPSILPTIRSRLPITVRDEMGSAEALALDMERLDIRSVYGFVQEHSRVDAAKAKGLLEQIGAAAMQSPGFDLDERTLDLMRDAFKVLDRGSPPSFVLTTVLLKLLARKKRKGQG